MLYGSLVCLFVDLFVVFEAVIECQIWVFHVKYGGNVSKVAILLDSVYVICQSSCDFEVFRLAVWLLMDIFGRIMAIV